MASISTSRVTANEAFPELNRLFPAGIPVDESDPRTLSDDDLNLVDCLLVLPPDRRTRSQMVSLWMRPSMPAYLRSHVARSSRRGDGIEFPLPRAWMVEVQ